MNKEMLRTATTGVAADKSNGEHWSAVCRGDDDRHAECIGTLQAGLFYVASDLRELAKLAPASKAAEIRALSRLIQALAAT